MNDHPIYTSESTAKNLWQNYGIFKDRVEFKTLFGTITIPFDNIESIEVQESDVAWLFKGDLKLKNFKPAIKLDWANFQEHIVLDKKEGFCKRFLFTPKYPNEFKKKLEVQLNNYRKEK